MTHSITKQIRPPEPSTQAVEANSTTGGSLQTNCAVIGGLLDVGRNALMNKGIASEVPLGLKTIVSINAGLSIIGGCIQIRDGLKFLNSAFKTEWVFGKQFGFSRIGTGLSLFCGGVLSLIQRIYEALLATGKVTAATAKRIINVVGKWGPIAYMSMFVVLIGMCALIGMKERSLRKGFDHYDIPFNTVQTKAGTPWERFSHTLKNLRAATTALDESALFEGDNPSNAQEFLGELHTKTFARKENLKTSLSGKFASNILPDGDFDARVNAHRGMEHQADLITKLDAVNNKINELTMLASSTVLDALKKGGEAIQGANAVTICRQLDTDLTEKRVFFTLLGIASVISILTMVGSLVLTGPVWAGVLLATGIALTAFFTMGNIKSMQMTLKEVKGDLKDRMTIYFVAGLIAAVGGVAILLSILNPVSLGWIILTTGIILGLEAIQVYQLRYMKKNQERIASQATPAAKDFLPTSA